MDSHALDVLEFDRIRRTLADACRSAMGRARARTLDPSSDPQRVRQLLAELRQRYDVLLIDAAPLAKNTYGLSALQ